MPTVSRTFTVSAPPDRVVEYLKDFEHATQWDPGTQSCERIDRGPVAEGAYWHTVSKFFGVRTELTYKLEELSDHRVVFVGENQSSRTVDTITVDPQDSGSVISYVADIEMQGTAKLFSPVIKLMFEKLAVETEAQMSSVLNGLATTAVSSEGPGDRSRPLRRR
ncbi:SRPBCC family protein [Mycolicibacterium sp. BiH015]|uniref:SRPBCC family protein n=1 Tax=Mycolicibacterium sp. BiH015 TaxID=3018808 RepID=UPI0022DFB9FB|nr:SRPBCC family protein [Mycolicibacterium sp. BiH015]MDA2892380.1 SRPBCC family protein [Mycolicibacterium sp. BiH015]